MIKYSIVQRNKARGDDTWYGRIFDTDIRKTSFISLGTTLKRIADEWLRQRIACEVAGISNNDVLLEKAVTEYVRQYEKTSSYQAEKIVMTQLKVFAADNGIAKLSDITPAKCIYFFNTLRDLKATTRHTRLTMYRSFYRWCARVYGLRADNPFAVVKVEKADPPDRSFWTTEQLYAILDATTDPEERFCYAVMAFAGLRISEALKLCWEDFHDGKVHIIGKGKKFASVPISKRLQAEIDRFGPKESGKIFCREALRNTYQHKLVRMMKNDPELNFGGRVHLHRFRHSFASNLARAGVSLGIIMKAMRHSSIAMTMRYAHLMPDDVADALDKV